VGKEWRRYPLAMAELGEALAAIAASLLSSWLSAAGGCRAEMVVISAVVLVTVGGDGRDSA
jgi:hypothetical protein